MVQASWGILGDREALPLAQGRAVSLGKAGLSSKVSSMWKHCAKIKARSLLTHTLREWQPIFLSLSKNVWKSPTLVLQCLWLIPYATLNGLELLFLADCLRISWSTPVSRHSGLKPKKFTGCLTKRACLVLSNKAEDKEEYCSYCKCIGQGDALLQPSPNPTACVHSVWNHHMEWDVTGNYISLKER